MFRETSPQRPLFGIETSMDPTKRARLERTWAHPFRNVALPLIPEQRFARFFDESDGRPNKSIKLVIGVLLLKEIFNLTDKEALFELEWNAAWHYALDVHPEEAHTCQKTLHNYRKMLIEDEEGAGLFESTTAKIIETAGLRTQRQRQDSTHIISNIKVLTRLGLFVKTIEHFLEALRTEHPRLCGQLPTELLDRYLDREGYFSDARSSEAPRRLEEAALDVYQVVRHFEDHRVVSKMESFQLLVRLYTEQCKPPATSDPERIELEETPSSMSLQSPADPDVTYGHKGKGYEVQLAETCHPDNPFEVVTAVLVNGAHESDQKQVEPILQQTERTCGAAPEKMHGDAGYGSGENILKAREYGTELLAPIGAKGSEQGIVLGDFTFSEEGNEVLMCPAGQVPVAHTQTPIRRVKLAVFAPDACLGCELQCICPTEQRKQDRVLVFTPADVAVARRRAEQQTPAFKEQHKIRSGIEGTNSELKRGHGLGKLRVRREPRVGLAVRLKVLGLNIKRYVGHLVDAAVQAAKGTDLSAACPC